MKRCTKCKCIKDESEFHKYTRSKDGLNYWCKQCKNADSRKWSKDNPVKANRSNNKSYYKYRDERLKTSKHQRDDNLSSFHQKEQTRRRSSPFTYKLNRIRDTAKQKGIEFDLTAQYLEQIWTGTCPIFHTKIQMLWGTGIKSGELDATSVASLDRIDNTKGYIQGNVQWMSKLANAMKNQATLFQLKQFADWIKGLPETSI